ncbi:hypothetical protein JG688_00017183 [Phytophthora aleatoria]|uniref:Uncharacterized protein n=1 Tax=Phytophthora aleatoria TaxID=2496075 RepID=A0A8J5I3C9_9STRA|nr:hypothetical protein JG688_00017183 [Phytophthora aleatoria]
MIVLSRKVMAVVNDIVATIVEGSAVEESHRTVARAESAASTKRSRRILEDESEEDVALSSAEDNTSSAKPMIAACVVNGDPS